MFQPPSHQPPMPRVGSPPPRPNPEPDPAATVSSSPELPALHPNTDEPTTNLKPQP